MSNIIKELNNPLTYNELPWRTINFLLDYKKKLDIQEILCLIENMYIETKNLASFNIEKKSNNSLRIIHPEVINLYNKGWLPNNYLISLSYFDSKGNTIQNIEKTLYQKILNKYGYSLIKRIIKNYFNNINREERFSIYKKISDEFSLLNFDLIIDSWKHNSKVVELSWLKDKEYGITLPTFYYSYGHVFELKKSYECFIPLWELEMELENLDHQQFIWKIEFYFQHFGDLKEIILRDPYHSIRKNKLLSFEKDFFYKVKVDNNNESVLALCDIDLTSALDTNIYKLFSEEAIVLGRNKSSRINSYKKMFNNLSYLNSRKVENSFFEIIEKFDFKSI